MTRAVVALIVVAAVAHASWNLLAKRGSMGGVQFVWLYTVVEVAIYAPVVGLVLVLSPQSVGWTEIGLMAGSAALHTGYFLLLIRGYAGGSLSLVYPVARGLGPMLAFVGAVALLGERPAPLAYVGAATVSVGILWLASPDRASTARRFGRATPGMGYALLTGVVIASYTLWDGNAMRASLISPILYQWGSNVGRLTLTTALLTRHTVSDITKYWSTYRREIIGVAVLAPMSYILILAAFSMAPIAYVAPARELSIVIGTAFGALLLREPSGGKRISASAAIVVGVVLLSVA